MTEGHLHQLFSSDPIVRLGAAKSASDSVAANVIPSIKDWIVNAFGSANAWLLVVGPSPGTGPGGKVDRPVLPVLGAALPEFKQFAMPSNDKKGFWQELFRLVKHGFVNAGLTSVDDAVLGLVMAMNLDTSPQGNGKKVTREMLRIRNAQTLSSFGVNKTTVIARTDEKRI